MKLFFLRGLFYVEIIIAIQGYNGDQYVIFSILCKCILNIKYREKIIFTLGYKRQMNTLIIIVIGRI